MDHHYELKPLSFPKSFSLFAIPAVYFFPVAYGLIPYLSNRFQIHPALSWFLGGYLVFIPLFVMALVLYRREGWEWNLRSILERFRIRRLSARDWYWTVGATMAILIATGVIMAGSTFLASRLGFHELATTPPFMKFNGLQGYQRWYLLVWFPMFFFNIVGEEILWRGAILPRQEQRHGRNAWLVNSFLWLLFHACFGLDLIITLLPTLLIIPYAVSKTKNTMLGIIAHGLLNGPMFVMVVLGLIH